jgi:hypothetical protein
MSDANTAAVGPNPIYPDALLDWAGHRKGGVRRIFYQGSGRPSGAVIQTPLLTRLTEWAAATPAIDASPKVLLLVGGPGNGKTEAIEYTVSRLDEALGANGDVVHDLGIQFSGSDGKPPPRLAKAKLSNSLNLGSTNGHLAIVQDASAADPAEPGKSPASLLVKDLSRYVFGDDHGSIYLACVNRGVLDDALIHAIEEGDDKVRSLIEMVIRSVGIATDAPSCWPLEDYPKVAIWPMDVESLVSEVNGSDSAAGQLLDVATNAAFWPTKDTCPAGTRCPFCSTKARLSVRFDRQSLLRLLRWYELASGKRWSFRDLFSLFSYLFAGIPSDSQQGGAYSPCKWAAQQLSYTSNFTPRQENARALAPFLLVASQYQHALFGQWTKLPLKEFRHALKELQLEKDPVLKGLQLFVAKPRHTSLPSTLAQQLAMLGELLDPALADPSLEVRVSGNTVITFRELDTRFSHSVSEGLRYIHKFKCLSQIEIDLLKHLESADEQLSTDEVVRRNASLARQLRAVIRDFSCRLVRRSIGVRGGISRDSGILADYEKLVYGDHELINSAVRKVKSLLNKDGHFTVALNTTFGEPLPPSDRLALLKTAPQKVRPLLAPQGDRPSHTLCFLGVGAGSKPQPVPLTYELFKSMRELDSGLSTASLPVTVVALLDTTRARMAGQIVRDDYDALDDAEISLGVKEEVVRLAAGKFSTMNGNE